MTGGGAARAACIRQRNGAAMPAAMARDDPPLIVHVFLSSPGDVPLERDAARDLLKAVLPYDPLLRGKVMFDVTSWDDPAAPSPMLPN
jgi:hypothetical protein